MIQQSLNALVLGLALARTQLLAIHFQEAVHCAILGLTHGGKRLQAAFLVQLVETPERLIADLSLDFVEEQVSRQAIGIELRVCGRTGGLGKDWSAGTL